MEGSSSQGLGKASKRSTHQWTTVEDAMLVYCLLELVNQGCSKDNRFRASYWNSLRNGWLKRCQIMELKVIPI